MTTSNSTPSARFPVHGSLGRLWEKHPDCPRSVPWEKIAPYEKQACGNHSQTLQRLAERGGLSPGEIRCAVEEKGLFRGRKWDEAQQAEDVTWLKQWLAAEEAP